VNNKPVPTQILTAREHIEIAQINILLQKTPLVVVDLSSPLMTHALAEGFVPCDELIRSGKTVIFIVPPGRTEEWFASKAGHKPTRVFEF
jgi:hypothetical protein